MENKETLLKLLDELEDFIFEDFVCNTMYINEFADNAVLYKFEQIRNIIKEDEKDDCSNTK